ncbi:chromate transporter [Petroclostridium sp. X23]|uniref:chromate transporter n=1 Tax=Petroclostridium sp. X23 TaxID=3045146 RepID=UPI0024ACBD64|nr:chromate transporter [Petroclostridium sp. X23]WHH61327.1 chromate transporter [Petroclostridium sp. X23]
MKKIELKTLWKMFMIFFRIGAFTIGGGYAMLPLIEREVVDNQNWVSEEEIVDVFAISQSIPGVIAINTSIFIGYKVGGIVGAIVAALGVILPSFLIILMIAFLLFNIEENAYVQKAFTGVRAGVVALIGLAAVKLGKAAVKDKVGMILAGAAFIAVVVFDAHPILMIIVGGAIGFIAYHRKIRNEGKA